jgi:hypothetical protein
MATTPFVQLCRELAAGAGHVAPSDADASQERSDADSLIGFFQLFRPDGRALAGLFDRFDQGQELDARLQQLYQVAGDDRRPSGGRDAYFIVRSPAKISPEQAEHYATVWLEGLRGLAAAVGQHEVAERLNPLPEIRVLEGIPPKPPKHAHEKSGLHLAVAEQGSQLTSRLSAVDPHAELLKPAYYFTACDPMLRDYLLWPFFATATGLDDPMRGYFLLWSHGAKYRIFSEDRVDIYLPRN